MRRLVRRHRWGVTAGGFVTGLGGIFTLPILLPTNVVEFYVQSTRMVGAIAAVRGYDLEDEEIRVRVLASLLGEESGEVLRSVGLGPVAGVAARSVAKQLPSRPQSEVANAIGAASAAPLRAAFGAVVRQGDPGAGRGARCPHRTARS